MKRSMVLRSKQLEKLVKKHEFENIIIGTGALARDMRRKLMLLGLKVPFLVGERSDPADCIKHYASIATLGNPELYRFLVCCDSDEWTLIGEALPVIYKFLGHAVYNHPQVIRFRMNEVLLDRACKRVTDAANCNVYLGNNKPYVVFGDDNDCNSFNIHILGSCHAGGVYSFSKESFPEILSQKLGEAGFHAAVYSWGQASATVTDCIMTYIRDMCFFSADLVILYLADRYSPLNIATLNTLSTRAGTLSGKHPFIKRLDSTYNHDVSDGISHSVDYLDISKTQQRIFTAFSRLYGFTYWNIIPPTPTVLPEEQAQQLHGLSSGYFTRQRKLMDEHLSIVSDEALKDYTDSFSGVEDIFSLFSDYRHLSSAGNRLIAQRCAADILEAFGVEREGL